MAKVAGERALVAIALALALCGCRVDHYMVVEDQVPLYATATGEQVVARLPRYYHEALEDEPEEIAERVQVRYRGKVAFAPRRAVRTFDYLHPALDGGDGRHAEVARVLREEQLDDVGRGWPRRIQEAVREGEVQHGMTRRQVELAWGWPTTVRKGPGPGEERWIYSSRTRRLVHHRTEGLWYGGTSWGLYPDPLAWHWVDGRADGGWITLRLPVIRERVVSLGPDGRVRHVDVRERPAR